MRCSACGIRLSEIPWARAGRGFTLLFEALVMAFVREVPVKALARQVQEHGTRLWHIVHHSVEQARAEVDFSDVQNVCMNEKAEQAWA